MSEDGVRRGRKIKRERERERERSKQTVKKRTTRRALKDWVRVGQRRKSKVKSIQGWNFLREREREKRMDRFLYNRSPKWWGCNHQNLRKGDRKKQEKGLTTRKQGKFLCDEWERERGRGRGRESWPVESLPNIWTTLWSLFRACQCVMHPHPSSSSSSSVFKQLTLYHVLPSTVSALKSCTRRGEKKLVSEEWEREKKQNWGEKWGESKRMRKSKRKSAEERKRLREKKHIKGGRMRWMYSYTVRCVRRSYKWFISSKN